MLCIHLKNTDPFFCLAAEEYLLKKFNDDIFMLWQSEDTVVVGKHQNALAEINYRYIRENEITLARRISGGGAVFHDKGNVNFTFIKNVNSPAEISFKQFTQPVVDSLAKLDLEATSSGRNDLIIQGLKISGNAEHVFKNRVLHHGTLLFNSDLKNLGQSIKVIPGKYISKAVQSNRSEVANISSFLNDVMDTGSFIQFLFDVQLESRSNQWYELKDGDKTAIQALSDEKFRNWEWNYGYSPKYSFQNSAEIGGKTISVELEVKKGIIEDCRISGDYFSPDISDKLSIGLTGKRHFFEDIEMELEGFTGNQKEDLIYVFF